MATTPALPKPPAAPTATKAPSSLALPSGVNSSYNNADDVANETYQSGLNDNTQQQGLTQNNYIEQFRNLAQQYAKQRTETPYTFNDRGMLGSGVFHQGLQDLDQANLHQYGTLQANQTMQLGGLQQQRDQLNSTRLQTLSNIEMQRQAALASLAAGSIK